MESETVSTQKVVVRRAPKFLTFMVAGIIVGIFVALVLTFAFPNYSDFTLTQIFGFLMLITASVGGTLGLIFALVFDRFFSKRTVTVDAERIEVTED